MIGVIKFHIQKILLKRKWNRANTHNKTSIVNVFPIDKVKVGNHTYGGLYVQIHNDVTQVTIGSYCSIAPGVKLIAGSDHSLNHVSTYPFKSNILNKGLEGQSKGDITVKDDVWIGENAIILSGVYVGQGAVIAAGALVTSDVAPYAVVTGIPAKVIKYRFSEAVRNFFITLDYNKLDEEMIREHEKEFYVDLDKMELEEIKELYRWFPKKHPDTVFKISRQ